MRHLLSNSYRMWALRLIVVLAAVGGGLTWWTLGGDEAPTIVADQESCTKGAVVTDVDFSMAGQSYTGGKLRSVVSITGFISGKNLYLEGERRDGDGGNLEKRKSLWLDGDFYRRIGDEDWEYVPRERLMHHEPPFPINADIICPNLTHFTFATVEDVDLKNAWVVRHDGLLFGSGWYIDVDQFTQDIVPAVVDLFSSAGLDATVQSFASNPGDGLGGAAESAASYNASGSVEGEWSIFIADTSGAVVFHFNPEIIGQRLEDLLGTDASGIDEGGTWLTSESMRASGR